MGAGEAAEPVHLRLEPPAATGRDRPRPGPGQVRGAAATRPLTIRERSTVLCESRRRACAGYARRFRVVHVSWSIGDLAARGWVWRVRTEAARRFGLPCFAPDVP